MKLHQIKNFTYYKKLKEEERKKETHNFMFTKKMLNTVKSLKTNKAEVKYGNTQTVNWNICSHHADANINRSGKMNCMLTKMHRNVTKVTI